MLFLAPMEGVVDHLMRELLTEVGGFDHCVTEFLRVTDQLIPLSLFKRHCPELEADGKTASGTPVTFQLLGGKEEFMAINAKRAADAGVKSLDLNFGCPSPTVNRHDGGATLLKTPDRVFKVVKNVREALPPEVFLSAKIRLGYDHKDWAVDIAKAAQEGGAQRLTVHARTKLEGYRPPAHWEYLAPIRECLTIPLVANGEIWSLADYIKCKEISGCTEFMIGRGAVANPWLALSIAEYEKNLISRVDTTSIQSETFEINHDDPLYYGSPELFSRQKLFALMLFRKSVLARNGGYAISRTKQWLNTARYKYPEFRSGFDQIKRITDPAEFELMLSHW